MRLLRQLKGCAPAAACERLRHLKSLFHRRDAAETHYDLKKPCFYTQFILSLDHLRQGLIPFLFCIRTVVCWSNFKLSL